MSKLRLAVLISGRGSNLQALIDACKDPAFPAEIAVVISNVPTAGGLERAANAGLPAMIVDHTYFKGDKKGFENSLAETINQFGVDLICLAGFMRILSESFLKKFKDRVINIHPSLLPKHKGLDTHLKALEAADTEHGCTVHVATKDMDAGEVILQRRVPVLPDDTAETLAARVLIEEHIAYPDAVRHIAEKRIVIRNGKVSGPAAPAAALPPAKPVKVTTPKQKAEKIMSHDHSHPVHATPESIARSHQMWNAFTKGSFYAGGAVVLVLVLLAVFVA